MCTQQNDKYIAFNQANPFMITLTGNLLGADDDDKWKLMKIYKNQFLATDSVCMCLCVCLRYVEKSGM